MTGELSPMHWLIVIVVFMVLFGAKRMPDVARGLGRSLRILKAELGADGSATTPRVAATATTPAAAGPTTALTYTAPTVMGLPAASASPTSADERPTT